MTWNDETEVYRAGYAFKNGCWEPSQVQLPSGEIQLFIANEGPYVHSDEQEITRFRSADGGHSWSAGETVSFRKGHRDGMPVPLLLRNKRDLLVAIEDNGMEGTTFKPVILHAATGQQNSITGQDKRRSYSFAGEGVIPPDKYAGAPYIRQLNTGEVIMSY
ncbi:MAG: hypothetical protein HC905_06470, partial [Bacteroidales bacterium]|nr:hypothetical protein [Bacteroidales bacterium]